MSKSNPLMEALSRTKAKLSPAASIPNGHEVKAVVPKSRQGKKALLTHHDPAVLTQLKQLSLDTDMTQQKLVAEALNMLFVKYGKSPIA
jgi:hypothetical protein